MILIRLFAPLSFVLQRAAAVPGLFMPLSFLLQVQIWMQLTVLMSQLDMMHIIIKIMIPSISIGLNPGPQPARPNSPKSPKDPVDLLNKSKFLQLSMNIGLMVMVMMMISY